MYKHFVSFGDICKINYTDGSEIGERINSKKDVLVSYKTVAGPLRAADNNHKDVGVYITDVVDTKDTSYDYGKF